MQIGANSGKCMQTYMTIAHMLFVQNTTIAHVICAKIAIVTLHAKRGLMDFTKKREFLSRSRCVNWNFHSVN